MQVEVHNLADSYKESITFPIPFSDASKRVTTWTVVKPHFAICFPQNLSSLFILKKILTMQIMFGKFCTMASYSLEHVLALLSAHASRIIIQNLILS